MAKNGRQKGSVAEREVAALVQAWWRQLEPACEFVRTPLSGGWQTPSIRSGFQMSGDLCTTAKNFPFCVEVKRREGWAMPPLLTGRRSPVWGWWRQCQVAAREVRKVPMLWIRRNRTPWLVILPGEKEGPVNEAVARASLYVSWDRFEDSVDVGEEWPVLIDAAAVLTIPPSAL